MEPEIDFAELRRSAKPMTSFREPRQSVMMQATLSCGAGAASARVRNISTQGLMAECQFRGEPGTRIAVSMRGIGEVYGCVAWVRKDCVGIHFDEPIEPSAVLRRPAATDDRPYVPHVKRAWRPPLHCS